MNRPDFRAVAPSNELRNEMPRSEPERRYLPACFPLRSQRGFSLIELLIAMTLGLILLAGMITVLEGNRRSSELNSTMADLQESARFALDAMARDTRMSGYQGCADINNSDIEVITKTPKFSLQASASTGALVGTDAWEPEHPLGFTPPDAPAAVAGTHALVLQFAGTGLASLKQQMSSGTVPSLSAAVVLDGVHRFVDGDLAIIADCDVANLFRVTGVTTGSDTTTLAHAASHNDDGNLTRAFGGEQTLSQTTVSRFSSSTYYIGDTGQTNAQGDPIRALYLQTLPFDSTNNPPVELVQGVDNLRVAFGMRSGNTLRYVTPDDASFDPLLVESIQIGLLMSSVDRISSQNDQRTYILAGQPISPLADSDDGNNHSADARFRLAFNTTIKVRNRRAN